MLKNHEQWVDANFLYQPTAADEAVLAILGRNGGARKGGALGKGCNNSLLSIM
jgi:hypothetical protein